ncbi:hypothetical protein TcasGA2_TC034101 [Tribolium castaneum]|uniref:Uncharacterized protein n=1 Tax=Tribolium castaneum TaxID=7070 RepID=A0A139WDD2_TRICA|nr:hypothetical protein TcasGA2_TC034101 [Tribolium castaneum]
MIVTHHSIVYMTIIRVFNHPSMTEIWSAVDQDEDFFFCTWPKPSEKDTLRNTSDTALWRQVNCRRHPVYGRGDFGDSLRATTAGTRPIFITVLLGKIMVVLGTSSLTWPLVNVKTPTG